MIIVGYQGIGKSTLAGNNGCIDLESGNFWVDGKRDEDWYKIYANIAVHLSQQGYTVFTASHKVVRDELKNCGEPVVVAYPSLDLETQWIEKLRTRYEYTNLEKDFKAWKNAEQMYKENITDLMNEKDFYHLKISGMDYELMQGIIAIKGATNGNSNKGGLTLVI